MYINIDTTLEQTVLIMIRLHSQDTLYYLSLN